MQKNDNWIEKSELLIRIPQKNIGEPSFIYYNKIAGFNFDYTLIKPENGLTYQSLTDWELFHNKVTNKIISLHKDEYSIVIFSNLDIVKNKSTRESLKHRFDKFCEIFFAKEIPIIGIFSMRNEVCRKPHTGMWSILCKLYEMKRFPKPDAKISLFVGNNAGRKQTKKDSTTGKIMRDKSCMDRAFAWNLGVKFYTPDQFFLNKSAREFKYHEDLLTTKEKIQIKEESEKIRVTNPFQRGVKFFLVRNFKNIRQFLIIIVGPPTSTKTSLSEYIIRRTKKHIENNIIKPWVVLNSKSFGKTHKVSFAKCAKKLNEEITYGNSVIIDGTNETIECRKKYIDVVKNFDNIGILIIELCVPARIAQHINHIKIEMLKKFDLKKTKSAAFTQYNKKFIKPDNTEFKDMDENRWKIISYPFLLIDIKEWWYIYSK